MHSANCANERVRIMRNYIVLGLLAMMLGLSFYVSSCNSFAYCFDDWKSPGIQRLWTTNSTGEVEINKFNVGDHVYLKTGTYAPATPYPIVPGTYTVYVFVGDIVLNATHNGKIIPTEIGSLAAPPLDITTNNMGHFGQSYQGGPIMIWNSAQFGQYTIVLDRKSDLAGVPDANYGIWQSGTDYREDGCTAIPTPPSFFVIPEVPLGTLAGLVSLLCGLGLFVKIRKKS
jgi:hypothetical protein